MNNMYDILDKMKLLEGRGSKPDFLDLDKDGDKNEPMKKAAQDKKVDEAVEEVAESDMDESALQAYLGKKKYGEAGMKALQQAGREGASKEKMAAIRAKHDKVDEAEMGEGNDFTGARLAAIKAGKPTFSVGGKTYKVTGDTSDEKVMEKKGKTLWPGTPEYKAKFGDEMRTGEKKRSSTGGEIEKTATGVRHTKSYDDDEGEDTKADDGMPKRRGRPKGSKRALGAKGPTGKSKLLKGKAIREMEDEEMISVVDKGEYDREGDMAREQLHTVMDAAKELHSILDADENLPEWVQSKITKALDYLDTARDYVKASDAEDKEMTEVAPPGAKAERMVKHIKKGYAKDGKLTPKEKSIAYATAWKAHKAGKVEEESDDNRDERAERAGRRVTKDIEYDEKDHDDIHGKRRGSEDDKAERAGKKVTKDIEYDEKKKKEEVDETTVSGSVATAPAEAPKGKKGMIFGKGVYEGYEQRFKQLLTEGMSINMSVGEDGTKSLNVNATDDDAIKLAQILKLAGMEQASGYDEACPTCGQSPCGCESLEEADYANTPEETGADINTLVNTYSDGQDGQKTTGQTTIPVIAGQTQRMMSQVKEQAEQRLWDLYKQYESK